MNPPIGKLLLMYDPETKQYFFGIRGPFSFKIGQTQIEITDDAEGMAISFPYSDFKVDEGAGYYWCMLQAPDE